MDGKGGDLDWVLFVGLAGCWAGGKKKLRNLISENGSRNALWGDNLRVGDLGLELWRANPNQQECSDVNPCPGVVLKGRNLRLWGCLTLTWSFLRVGHW